MINRLTLIHNLTKLQARLHPQPSRVIVADRMIQRFHQLGVTVSAHNFFGVKLVESALVQDGKAQQYTFILPQRHHRLQAA